LHDDDSPNGDPAVRHAQTIEFKVVGELDMATAPGLVEEFRVVVPSTGPEEFELSIDAAALTFLDIVGFRALASMCDIGRSSGLKGVVVVNPHGQVARFFEVWQSIGATLPFTVIGSR